MGSEAAGEVLAGHPQRARESGDINPSPACHDPCDRGLEVGRHGRDAGEPRRESLGEASDRRFGAQRRAERRAHVISDVRPIGPDGLERRAVVGEGRGRDLKECRSHSRPEPDAEQPATITR